jgi:AAA family ATP:ADP antiporter
MSEARSVFRRAERAVERVVGSDVHAGEWRVVWLFFTNLFLLLTAYYILKVVREPLILMSGGAVSRSYARGLQAGLLVVLIPAYSALANRVEPARLVTWIMGTFVVSLVVFFGLARAGGPVGFPFFVWLGIFSTLSIAQFWSLANDLLTEAEGKRLFPLIAVGGTLGAIAGAQVSARAIGRIAPPELMLIAAALLVGCMVLTNLGRRARPGVHARAAASRDRRGGFTLVAHDRYLLLIGLSVVILNLVTATSDFIVAQMVSAKAATLATAAKRHYIASFYGNFQAWVSAVTAVIQIVVVGRVFRRIGVGNALYFMPVLAIVSYSAVAVVPLLAIATLVKGVESCADYSLENTLQQALFLPTSRDAKYKAKSAIDTVSKRLGDLTSTGLVAVGVPVGLGVSGFAVANVVAGVLWVWLTFHLRRRQRALVAAGGQPPAVAVPPGSDRVLAAAASSSVGASA